MEEITPAPGDWSANTRELDKRPLVGRFFHMAYALAKENEAFIERMLKLGRFNNQSEVVREALRRMERDETSYLNPPPLTEQQLSEIYGPNPKAEQEERVAGATIIRSIRKAAKKHRGIERL